MPEVIGICECGNPIEVSDYQRHSGNAPRYCSECRAIDHQSEEFDEIAVEVLRRLRDKRQAKGTPTE